MWCALFGNYHKNQLFPHLTQFLSMSNRPLQSTIIFFATGSLELSMRHLLFQCISVDKLFTLKMLNERLCAFSYGPDATNKPTQLSPHHVCESGTIKQSGKIPVYLECCKAMTTNIPLYTASQMWCLGRFLPILIGDKIPTHYPYWENFIAQLNIMNEVFAPIVHEDRLEYLALLIEDYLRGFRTLYPNRSLTPKMHYLLHIPTWIKRQVLLCTPVVMIFLPF